MGKFLIDGGHPLQGSVTPSGNKNEALPALMACLLTEEPVTLCRMPKIRDVLTVCEILVDLGGSVEWVAEDKLVVCCKGVKSYQPDAELCAKVRASILLLGPLLARFGKIELAPPGGDVIGARRVDTHIEGVEALGCQIQFGNPIRGYVSQLVGTDIYLDEPSVTATENLLLIAALAEGRTVLHNAASEPHVVGISKLLVGMGAKISGIGSNRITIDGVSSLQGTTHTIGPDFMEVGSFLCLGAIGRGVVRIEGVEPEDMRFPLKTLARLGIRPEYEGNALVIDGTKELVMQTELSGRIASIYSGPWPSYPTDLMSVAIVAATQAKGTVLFHEKMFEGRMFFTDNLMSMGANIVLCDPHRVVVTGPNRLTAARMSSPDVRAGMALVMAACIAHGQSQIDNIYQVERAYYNIAAKLEGLGAHIRTVRSD
ncbi:MAG: UDP-N-acetylglucosamine 1-carboxyvinyltransferase [Zetaproteobacteria bacterium]|nr:UDP-N-acetylglucosamine 1-carboxyvinyltransferase [Zetaproteobacteria bacterium]